MTGHKPWSDHNKKGVESVLVRHREIGKQNTKYFRGRLFGHVLGDVQNIADYCKRPTSTRDS